MSPLLAAYPHGRIVLERTLGRGKTEQPAHIVLDVEDFRQLATWYVHMFIMKVVGETEHLLAFVRLLWENVGEVQRGGDEYLTLNPLDLLFAVCSYAIAWVSAILAGSCRYE